MVSDATIYKFDSSHYWVLPTLETDLPYVRDLTSRYDVQIESFTSDFGLLDIQGPDSREVLAQLWTAILPNFDTSGSGRMKSKSELYAASSHAPATQGDWV